MLQFEIRYDQMNPKITPKLVFTITEQDESLRRYDDDEDYINLLTDETTPFEVMVADKIEVNKNFAILYLRGRHFTIDSDSLFIYSKREYIVLAIQILQSLISVSKNKFQTTRCNLPEDF